MVNVSAAVNLLATAVSNDWTLTALAYAFSIAVVSFASNLLSTLAELAEYNANGTAPKLVVPISTHSLL